MDKVIKEQLSKVSVAKVPYFTEDTTEIIIPKYKPMIINVNGYYIFRLSDHMCSENSSIFINWNNRVRPPKYIIGMVEKVLPNMILVAGCRFDTETQKATTEYYKVWIVTSEIEEYREINPVNYV